MAACLLLTACGKSFLEKIPAGTISSELVFTDLPGIRAGLTGTYSLMVKYYTGEFTLYGDVASDHVTWQGAGTGNDVPLATEYSFNSNAGQDENTVGHIWLNIFTALNNINNVLNAVPVLKEKFPASGAELDRIAGQALILRALCHFDLSKVYAQTYQYSTDASHLGIPVILKTPPPRALVPRNTIKETYSQVITDLKEGERLLKLNPVNDPFATSHFAAWGLLSRVYLYMGEWDQSIAYADSVITKGNYTLTTAANYLNMYASATPGTEVIWQLYSRRPSNGITPALVYVNTYFASDKLLSLFDQSDIRKQVFKQFTVTLPPPRLPVTVASTLKYAGPIANAPMDPKVVRLSEVYLNRAEAKWNKNDYNGAIADVRLVAERAHNGNTIAIPSDPTPLFDFICDERSRELCFEGHRLYDIARRKQSVVRGSDCTAAMCTLTYPNVRFVLPIPQKELDANKAMQPNPGIN
jgi:tetratricopeptide (TPR) repeat protein